MSSVILPPGHAMTSFLVTVMSWNKSPCNRCGLGPSIIPRWLQFVEPSMYCRPVVGLIKIARKACFIGDKEAQATGNQNDIVREAARLLWGSRILNALLTEAMMDPYIYVFPMRTPFSCSPPSSPPGSQVQDDPPTEPLLYYVGIN